MDGVRYGLAPGPGQGLHPRFLPHPCGKRDCNYTNAVAFVNILLEKIRASSTRRETAPAFSDGKLRLKYGTLKQQAAP